MENKEQISEIKLLSGGLKGLEVCYSKVEKGKDERDWINEYWTKRSIPVNKELLSLVNSFRFYLYDVYGYDMDKVNSAELEILGIKGEGGSFIIKGKQKILDGTKYVDMKTPKILEDDGYGKYGEVMGLVGQLFAEVGVYMTGARDEISDLSIVKNGFRGKKGELFNEEEFLGMSEQEQRDMATKVLEKHGSIVIHNDDMDLGVINNDSKEDFEETVRKEVDNIIKNEGVVSILKEISSEVKPEGNVIYKIKPMGGIEPSFEPVTPSINPESLVSDEDDSFAIAPVKKINF